MKKITLLFIICLTMAHWSHSQCTTSTGGQWPSSVVALSNGGGLETIATNNWPNAEYSLISGVLPGSDYSVAGTGMYITVTNAADDSIITHGTSPVTFTAGPGVTDLIIYWHLDAICGTQNSGDTLTTIQCTTCVCTETAAPNQVVTPTPADGSSGINFTGTLLTPFSWIDASTGPVAESYTLYLGTDPAGTNIGSIADITNGNGINYAWVTGTTYYWRIDATNCFGTTTGTVWSFTTYVCTATAAPNIASVNTPANGASNVVITYGDPNSIGPFEWTDAALGDPADTYNFNLGVTAAGNDIGTVENFSSGGTITYDFQPGTTYYWSVDPINCFGTSTGTVWSFTTSACTGLLTPNAVTSPSPADLAGGVAITGPDGDVTLSWTAGDVDDTFVLYFGTTNPPTQAFNNFENGESLSGLAENATYYWSVDAYNCIGGTAGNVWTFTTGTLGVDTVELEGFKVYPNPTSDIINIKSSQDIESVLVYNLLGQNVMSVKGSELMNDSLNISELNNGIYLVKISSEDSEQTIRIIKE